MGKDSGFNEALDTFSQSFAAGDAETFAGLFAEDAKALLHEEPTLAGRDAIREMDVGLFAMVDTAEFEVDYDTIDVQGDRAYVLASFQKPSDPGTAPPPSGSTGASYASGGERKMAGGR